MKQEMSKPRTPTITQSPYSRYHRDCITFNDQIMIIIPIYVEWRAAYFVQLNYFNYSFHFDSLQTLIHIYTKSTPVLSVTGSTQSKNCIIKNQPKFKSNSLVILNYNEKSCRPPIATALLLQHRTSLFSRGSVSPVNIQLIQWFCREQFKLLYVYEYNPWINHSMKIVDWIDLIVQTMRANVSLWHCWRVTVGSKVYIHLYTYRTCISWQSSLPKISTALIIQSWNEWNTYDFVTKNIHEDWFMNLSWVFNVTRSAGS